MNVQYRPGQDHLVIAKAATGIEGLDEVTFGGLPQGRPTLLCGSAGCGKTLFSMTFLGKARWREDVHPHESPWIMMGPVAILAVLSFGAGWYLSIGEKFVNWLEPITGTPEPQSDHPYLIPAASLTLVAIGAAIAWFMYSRNPVPVVPPRGNLLTRAAREELYGNAVNEAVFMRPGQWLTRFLVWFDNRVVDGVVNGTAATIGGLSGRVRRLQTGFTRSYALSMLGGAALVAVALVLVRL